MVSGDVFRPPGNATLLCVQLGSGVQIILSSFITLFFAALGAPSARAPLSPHCDVRLGELDVYSVIREAYHKLVIDTAGSVLYMWLFPLPEHVCLH